MKNKQVTDATDCSAPQLITKTSSNRVAAWHAQRNARESEASHLIWLDRESGARTAQRKKRSRLISITEHCSSFENNVDNNKNETGNKEMNEVREKTVGKLDNQSRQKNKLRKNQHLLHPVHEMPSCVIRLNIDIDSNSECVKMSEQVRNSLIHAKDSSVIINRMLLYRKAINLETGCGIICNKCYKYLISNKMPAFALNNSMWVNDVPQELQELTLSEQKLIALYRHSSCMIKLFSITCDPSLAQTALKGNVITFPQNVSKIARSFPLSSDELSQFIKIIFVGKSLPKKDQLRPILTNNILYKYIHIDHLLIDTLPINNIPDWLWNTLSLVDESESQNAEHSGYINNYIDSNDLPENEIISLNTSALIDTDGGATSSIDIRRHLIRWISIANEVVASDDNIYFILHGKHP
ncbi:unnamed protein product, partial [Rotaria sordida]